MSNDDSSSSPQIVRLAQDAADHTVVDERLLQTQKMEALGRLAGGIAHDFNNLLTVIQAYGVFVLEQLQDDSSAALDLQEVLGAAARASELTSQLLAFSRRQPIAPRIMCINEHVRDVDRMLRRVLGEDIDYRTELQVGLWDACVDPTSFEQLVMNLVVNARDAMPVGGALTVRTCNVTSDGSNDLPAGQYAMLSVADTGKGMAPEVLKHAFEPFFTTKERGRGTGLGLATCYGVVSQAGGVIAVDSTPGVGTAFRVYLPRRDGATTHRPSDPGRTEDSAGSETILIVEDEEPVRRIVGRTLFGAGYEVLIAESPREALSLASEHADRLDLLLTDVVMPQMGGPEVAAAVRELNPHVPVLYMSGYTEERLEQGGLERGRQELLRKPFTPQKLLESVREILTAAQSGAAVTRAR